MTRRLIAIAVLVLLCPGALAVPVSGSLAFRDGAAFDGPSLLASEAGALDLAPAIMAGEAPSLTFAGGEGYVLEWGWEFRGQKPAEVFYSNVPRKNESLDVAQGSLQGVTCKAGCVAMLLADPGTGARIELAGDAGDPIRPIETPIEVAFGYDHPGEADSFYWYAEAGSLAFSGDASSVGSWIQDGIMRAEGDLVLVLWNATADIAGPDGLMTLETGTSESPVLGPAGIPIGRTVTDRIAIIHLREAHASTIAGSAAQLIATSVQVDVTGSLIAASASGILTVDGRSHPITDESLRVDGTLGIILDAPDAPTLTPIEDASGAKAGVSGDASSVIIGGAPVSKAPLSRSAVGAIGLLAALAILAWSAIRWAPVLLYSRLVPDTLLKNPNRRAIVEAVRAKPGASVADLVRATGLTEVVVRHHLRMLATHRFVTSRGAGKSLGYFAAETPAIQQRGEQYIVLRDASRRAVADAVRRAPMPLSQKEVAEATGLSQRLVSYHLGRLEESGLVATEGTMPRRYAATAPLHAVLVDGTAASSA